MNIVSEDSSWSLKIKPHPKCGFKMGSDVYGLPSQETYLDSQIFLFDAAKLGVFH